MIVFSAFMDHVGRLVHPDVQPSELDRAQHRAFLVTRFGLAFVVVATSLLSLAIGIVPRAWGALAVVWLMLPFVAAIHLSRTGRLREAEAASLFAWLGLGLSVTLTGGTSLVGGCVLLAIVPLEASFGGRPRTLHAAGVAALVGAAGLSVAAWFGLPRAAATVISFGDAVLVLPALVYAVTLARVSLSLQRRRQRLAAVGEERYRVLSEAIGDLVLRYDRSGGVLMASREAEALFGIRPRDLLGRGFFERVLVADRPAFLKLFADAAATGDNVSARLRFRTARHTIHERGFEEPIFAWIEIRARRFDATPAETVRRAPAAHEPPPIVAIVRDITAQMEHEQAIEIAKQDAERHNQWKDAFLANVSHELRTPLNAIIGFSEMLASVELSPRDPEKQRDYARIITSSGQHLLSVVNSLLDISKIEAGRFDINPEPFGLGAMIQSCCDMIGLKAEQAGIALSRDIAPALGEIVGDKRACKQIMINLLSNALKFTPAGGTVSVAARADGETVLVSVIDSGIGIATRDLERLGDAFFQAKSGLDRPYEGTGLGLSVVRGLVGLHGGSIAIASAPGEGTTVTLRLPLDCRVASPVPSAKIETISLYGRASRPVETAPVVKVQNVA